jgi:hypothetical protein
LRQELARVTRCEIFMSTCRTVVVQIFMSMVMPICMKLPMRMTGGRWDDGQAIRLGASKGRQANEGR